MNSRKRQAQPLHPLRSPKQPRLALKGYSGGSPSPSQTEGLGSRWMAAFKQTGVLLIDTATALSPFKFTRPPIEEDDSDTSEEETPSLVLDSSPSPNSTSLKSTSTISNSNATSSRKYPTAGSQDSPVWSTLNATFNDPKLPENIPLPSSPIRFKFDDRPICSHPSASLPFLPDFPDQSTPKNNVSPFASSTPAITPTPTRIPTETPRFSPADCVLSSNVVSDMRNLHLGDSVDRSAASSSQTSKSSSLLSDLAIDINSQMSGGSSQPLRRRRLNALKRDHIYAKAHKSRIVRQRREDREQMIRDTYEMRRRAGYKSDLEDFKGLLNYQHRLQTMELENAHPLQRSLLFGPKEIRRETRRPAEIDGHFLQQAFDKAKATLESPKPPRPFVPAHDQLQVKHRMKDDEIERRIRPPRAPLPSRLPTEDERKVDEVLRTHSFVSKFAREQVSHSDLSRLKPGQWLNDEIINFYGAMLLGRSDNCKENSAIASGKTGTKAPLNIHYFSSFFWAKLAQEGYDKGRLAKWTKKIDIFSKDIVFMPVNHGNAHWTAAAINFRAKRFESYDSMGIAKGPVFRKLREYVKAEHQNKKKKDFDFTGWKDYAPESTPLQENGYDCGVFTCQFMEALSRGDEFGFSQEDMPYLRRRMIWEIAHGKLRDDR